MLRSFWDGEGTDRPLDVCLLMALFLMAQLLFGGPCTGMMNVWWLHQRTVGWLCWGGCSYRGVLCSFPEVLWWWGAAVPSPGLRAVAAGRDHIVVAHTEVGVFAEVLRHLAHTNGWMSELWGCHPAETQMATGEMEIGSFFSWPSLLFMAPSVRIGLLEASPF